MYENFSKYVILIVFKYVCIKSIRCKVESVKNIFWIENYLWYEDILNYMFGYEIKWELYNFVFCRNKNEF